MLEAYTVRYDKKESKIALGMYNGLIQLSELDPKSGRPGATLHHLRNETNYITMLEFIEDETKLLSLDENGFITVWNCDSGEKEWELKIADGMSQARGSLSPDQSTLFIYGSRGYKDAEFFAVDLQTQKVTEGPLDKRSHSGVKPYAIDNTSCRFHTLWEDDDDVLHQKITTLDFSKGEFEDKTFLGGPTSTIMSDEEVFTINIVKDIGVRLSYDNPITENDDKVGINIQVFHLTNDNVNDIVVATIDSENVENLDIIRKKEFNTEEYRDACNSLFMNITSAEITEDGTAIWVGVRGGLLRRISIEDQTVSPFIKHGNLPEREGFTLDDMCSRNPGNNHTIGVSPSGKFVTYCNPNEFFSLDNINFDSETAIELPKHVVAEDESSSADQVETHYSDMLHDGKYFVSVTRGGLITLTDLSTGESLASLDIQYGSDVTSVSLSEDANELVVTYFGRDSIRIYIKEKEIEEFEMIGPSIRYSSFLPDGRLLFVEGNGAVIVLGEKEGMIYRKEGKLTLKIGDDEMDDEVDFDESGEEADFDESMDEDEFGENGDVTYWMDFLEQRDPVYSTKHTVIDGVVYVSMVYDNMVIDTYRILEDRIEYVTTTNTRGEVLKMSGSTMLCTRSPRNSSRECKVEVHTFKGHLYELAGTFVNENISAFETFEDKIYLFNSKTDQLTEFDKSSDEEKVLFSYKGAPIDVVSINPSWNSLIIKDVTGSTFTINWSEKSCRSTGLTENSEGEVSVSVDSSCSVPGNFEPATLKRTFEKGGFIPQDPFQAMMMGHMPEEEALENSSDDDEWEEAPKDVHIKKKEPTAIEKAGNAVSIFSKIKNIITDLISKFTDK